MEMMRAFSAFEVKSLDSGARTFTGIATTPTIDRMGDVIDPLGAKLAESVPLLHQHNRSLPIGRVRFGKPKKNGIEFRAEIPVIDEPASLKERVDTAWGEIKHGLVRSVSIGFNPIKYSLRDDGGVNFHEIEILELSSVTIPALPDAVITSIKSMGMAHQFESLLRRSVRLIDPANRGVKLIARTD